MARAAGTGKPAATSQGARLPALFWLKGMVCGAVLMISPAALIVAVMLFAPLVVIVLTESGSSRYTSRTAALFGLAASLPMIAQFWSSGATVAAAFAILHDPHSLFRGWIAIGGAWLLLELISIGVRLGLEISARVTEQRQRAEIETLLAEWGEQTER